MKLIRIVIRLDSALGTPLKGDTLFGHFCWQAAHEPSLLRGGLENWISQYPERPFAIFSSAFPCFSGNSGYKYALPRPALPLTTFLDQQMTDRRQRLEFAKGLKKKKWILLDEDLDLAKTLKKPLGDKDLLRQLNPDLEDSALVISTERPHNTINRCTQSTGSGMFAPYVQEVEYFLPEATLAVFVLFDTEALEESALIKGLDNIGLFGFGRDASTGLGRFRILDTIELEWPKPEQANACYTLSPSTPENGAYADYFFTPFVRFGKHGGPLAAGRMPFKNPVLMADEAAVLLPRNKQAFKKPYLGRAGRGISVIQPEAVTQGYSLYLPFRLELDHGQ